MPSKNSTEPVGAPAGLVTAAVIVTDCPNTDGFTGDVNPVAVEALFTVKV